MKNSFTVKKFILGYRGQATVYCVQAENRAAALKQVLNYTKAFVNEEKLLKSGHVVFYRKQPRSSLMVPV